MYFLGRWITDCIELICMLAVAVLLMQVPAVTHVYTVSLLQVAQDARRDIDRREADARQYYHLAPATDDTAVISALRPVEPSNAEALQQSVTRAAMFSATVARLTSIPPLGRPVAAAWDAAMHPDPDKLAVLKTSYTTYVPQVALNLAAATYGIAGLLLGGLFGHTVSAILGVIVAPRRQRRRA